MATEPRSDLLTRGCRIAAALVLGVGALGGWGLMPAGAAILFAVAAAGLSAGASRRFLVQSACGGTLFAASLLSLFQTILARDLAGDQAVSALLAMPTGAIAACLILGVALLAAANPRGRATAPGLAALSLIVLGAFALADDALGIRRGASWGIFDNTTTALAAGILASAAGLLCLGWRDGDRCGQLPLWLPHASATAVCTATTLLAGTLISAFPVQAGPLVVVTTLTLGSGLALLAGTSLRLMQVARERAAHSDRIADALAQSENRLKLALDNARHALWDWDVLSGRVVLDDNWCRLLAYGPADMPGSVEAWAQAIHPGDRARVLDLLAQSLRSDEVLYDVEYRTRRGDGQWIWINTRGRVQSRGAAGEPLRMLGTIHDVTERKRAQQAREQQEARYRTIVDAASDLIYRTDAAGRFTFVNAAAERVLQTPGSELLGRHYLSLVRPEAREATRQFYARQVEERRATTYYEFPVVTTTDQEIWLGQNVQLLLDDGRVTGFQGLARDITERRAMERALKEAHDEALDSARLKSEFLANVSHEIRTPMNGVIGLAGLLLDTPLSAEQRGFVDGIRSSGDSLLTIINDVLDSSKIEAGMLQIDALDFDLRAVTDATIQLFAEAARQKQLRLTGVVDDDVPKLLRGDPGRIRQVMTNLLGNAVKFTSSGQVTLHVTRETLECGRPGIRCAVRDTGIGVTPQAAARIFQPFVQADGSTTRRYGGTGLGLAISKRLVELMGGTIAVDSLPGAGSTFWFTLPAISAVPADPEHLPSRPLESRDASEGDALRPAQSAAGNGIASPRILVAEDNAVNRQVVHGQLRALGYRVTVVDDGEEALRMLEGTQYAAVLMDCQMPHVDGFTATAEIRRREGIDRHTPIIALTAYATSGERARCLAAGMDDYLSKPVNRHDLARVLARWVTRVRAEPEVAVARTVPSVNSARLEDVRKEVGGETLAEFVSAILAETERLRRLAEHEDAGVRAAAHRLRGSAGTLGFESLAAICEEIEDQSPGPSPHRSSILRLIDEQRRLIAWSTGVETTLPALPSITHQAPSRPDVPPPA